MAQLALTFCHMKRGLAQGRVVKFLLELYIHVCRIVAAMLYGNKRVAWQCHPYVRMEGRTLFFTKLQPGLVNRRMRWVCIVDGRDEVVAGSCGGLVTTWPLDQSQPSTVVTWPAGSQSGASIWLQIAACHRTPSRPGHQLPICISTVGVF